MPPCNLILLIASLRVDDNREPSLASLVISLLQEERIQAHPLNNNVYIMCTPFTSQYDKQRIVRVLKRCLTKAHYLRPTSGGFEVHVPSSPPS